MRGTLTILLFFVGMSLYAQFSPGKLTKAHAEFEGLANCTKCHDLGNKVSDTKCLDCHKELSSLVDANRGYHASQDVKSQSCIKCHSEHHGLNFDMVRFDTVNFDHLLTGYELEGAHQQIDCRECHKPDYISDSEIALRSGTYLGLEESCLTCHIDYHQETLSEDCLSCHRYESFEEAPRFDHQKTEFPLRGAHETVSCEECHPLGKRSGRVFQEFKGMPFEQCIDCHEDIHQGRFGIQCTDCHSEDSWSQLKTMNHFDHDLTDYPLEGLHRAVACAECHTGGDFARELSFAKCTDCHDNYHQDEIEALSLGIQDCDACHSLDQEFTYSSYGILEHDSSEFPLEGAHLATPCFECHKSDANTRWDFEFESHNCVACHEDIHENFISPKYYPAQDCEACHNSEHWQSISFDHQLTDWPLEGKHAESLCSACHYQDDGSQEFKGIAQACQSCHDNSHGDQFGLEALVDCSSCHRSSFDWKAENFDHQETQFPLEGRHAEVECSACHKPQVDKPDWGPLYKIEKFECIDCHAS